MQIIVTSPQHKNAEYIYYVVFFFTCSFEKIKSFNSYSTLTLHIPPPKMPRIVNRDKNSEQIKKTLPISPWDKGARI